MGRRRFFRLSGLFAAAAIAIGCGKGTAPDAPGPATAADEPVPRWERDNPVRPLPKPPLGITSKLENLKEPPTPERVRLGRWLFYDERLSADGTISCATCHRPEQAFSEPTPVSTGVKGLKGTRKAPSFINLGWTIFPHFFWDGRAASLEAQAVGPMTNPVEMGATHDLVVTTLSKISGYAPYFTEAFGSPGIDIDRVAKALADYERTRMSGNSPWDRWKAGDETALTEQQKRGDALFFGKAACNQCHFGEWFTDNSFHNLGVGWNPKTRKFADDGRFIVTKKDSDRGAFKTPGLRETTLHAPYMHDGSMATLRDVMVHYNVGGTKNPHLDPKMRPLDLTDGEIDDLVALMEALEGEGWQDTAPASFPN